MTEQKFVKWTFKNDLPLGCIKESYLEFNDVAGFR